MVLIDVDDFLRGAMMKTNLVDWMLKSTESSSIKLPNSWLIR
jgi:hypothetical protein